MESIVSLVVGMYAGWVCAHLAIADECKKLGAFYVRSEIFKCVKVIKYDEKEAASKSGKEETQIDAGAKKEEVSQHILGDRNEP